MHHVEKNIFSRPASPYFANTRLTWAILSISVTLERLRFCRVRSSAAVLEPLHRTMVRAFVPHTVDGRLGLASEAGSGCQGPYRGVPTVLTQRRRVAKASVTAQLQQQQQRGTGLADDRPGQACVPNQRGLNGLSVAGTAGLDTVSFCSVRPSESEMPSPTLLRLTHDVPPRFTCTAPLLGASSPGF